MNKLGATGLLPLQCASDSTNMDATFKRWAGKLWQMLRRLDRVQQTGGDITCECNGCLVYFLVHPLFPSSFLRGAFAYHLFALPWASATAIFGENQKVWGCDVPLQCSAVAEHRSFFFCIWFGLPFLLLFSLSTRL